MKQNRISEEDLVALCAKAKAKAYESYEAYEAKAYEAKAKAKAYEAKAYEAYKAIASKEDV